MEIGEYIREIVESKLNGTEYFVVDVRVVPQHKIVVFVDGDNGISVAKCAEISRYIQAKVEQDGSALLEHYALEVSSPGLDQPLRMIRQYRKNIGRRVQLMLWEGMKKNGILLEANEQVIVLEEMIDKKEKKIHEIPLAQIQNTWVIASF